MAKLETAVQLAHAGTGLLIRRFFATGCCFRLLDLCLCAPPPLQASEYTAFTEVVDAKQLTLGHDLHAWLKWGSSNKDYEASAAMMIEDALRSEEINVGEGGQRHESGQGGNARLIPLDDGK